MASVDNVSSSQHTAAIRKLKTTRDRTPKGKSNQPLNDTKHLDENKITRTSRIPPYIPKQPVPNIRTQKDKKPADTKTSISRQLRNSPTRPKNSRYEEKPKTSQIPRRRLDIKEPSIKESSFDDSEIDNTNELPKETLNIQRVELLSMNTDLYPERQSDVTSKAKPIPTFGQIYRHNYITDWLLESVSELIDVPEPSVIPIPRIDEVGDFSNNNRLPQSHLIVDSTQNRNATHNSLEGPVVAMNGAPGAFKTTDENVRDWLTSELEHLTRDNESGYRSMSPPSKVASSIQSKNIESVKPKTEDSLTPPAKALNEPSSGSTVTKENFKDSVLTEHKTVLVKNRVDPNKLPNVYQAMPKMNTDFKPMPNMKPDFHKDFKFPSTPNPIRKQEQHNNIPVPSYVEFPSEVIQKTTNFEGLDRFSSVVDTDAETDTRDDLSQCTLEQIEDDSVLDDRDHSWYQHQSSSQASTTMLNLSKASDLTSTWCSRFNDHKDGIHDDSIRKWSEHYNYHDYFHHYTCRKEENKKYDDVSFRDNKRCKKYQNYRRHSKKKCRLSQPFETLRKRVSIGRICRHRWKGVWKKTTERFTSWTRSPRKLRKLRAIHCLRHSVIWDNADVQTTIFVYREIGTDAVAKEQKSAEITASLKLKARTSVYNKVESGTSGTSCRSNKSQLKHVNIGPSLFPFLCASTSPVKCAKSKNCNSHCCNNHCDNQASVKELITSKDETTAAEHNIMLSNKSTSLTEVSKDMTDNGTETDPPMSMDKKVTSAMIHTMSLQTIDASPQDAYTQMLVTCNNAATNIKINTAPETYSSENLPVRSSSKFKSCGNDTEYQKSNVIAETLTPSRSTRAGAVSEDHMPHSRPSVVTDTTVPCRRIGTKQFSTMLTPKGTILSCTGTKITSVSSSCMQPPPVLTKQSAVVSTNVVTVNNVDCLTAKSLHYRGFKDVCLDTSISSRLFRDDKASCTSGLGSYHSAGVSAFDLIEQSSFNGGSHHAKRSAITEIHPEYTSTTTNTDIAVTSRSMERACSMERSQLSDGSPNTIDVYVQYSDHKDRDDTSKHTQHSACIGRSQLMSVRMLSDSGTEAAIQAQPESLSAETKTTPRKHMSTSAFTTGYLSDEQVSTAAAVDNEMGGVSPAPILVCGCARVGSGVEGTTCANTCSNTCSTTGANTCAVTQMQATRKSSEKPLRQSEHSNPIKNDGDDLKQATEEVTTKSKSCSASNNYQPNTVISSNLNAAKWMKGYHNSAEKEFQSIVDISRSTVSESLERASVVLAHSKAPIDENKTPSQIQHSTTEPAVNCLTSPATAVSSDHCLDVLPTKEHLTEPTTVASAHCRPCKMIDKITSDKVVPKEMKETMLQACPTVHESGMECLLIPVTEQKSAGVLTSRHILPEPAPCWDIQNKGGPHTDCVYVYDHPRCMIHKHRTDAAIQKQPSNRDFEMHFVKQETTRISAGSTPSLTGMVPQYCHQQTNYSMGEVLPLKAHSMKQGTVHRSAGQVTSFPQHSNRRSSDHTEELLSPKAYKALYETTKSIINGNSRHSTRYHTPATTTVCGSVCERVSEKVTSNSLQCSLQACSHCCCNLQYKKGSCTRSTQAVIEVMQICPNCREGGFNVPPEEELGSVEDYVKSYLTSSCRYYSDMLTKQLDRVRENFKKRLTPPNEEIYRTSTVSNMLIEACTMKPSGRQDHFCQTCTVPSNLSNHSPLPSLTQAFSTTDVRESQDKEDLKTMYYMLTSIEGRIRRLKSNLTT